MEAQVLGICSGLEYCSQAFDSISKPVDSIQPAETCTFDTLELLSPQLSGIFNEDLSRDSIDGTSYAPSCPVKVVRFIRDLVDRCSVGRQFIKEGALWNHLNRSNIRWFYRIYKQVLDCPFLIGIMPYSDFGGGGFSRPSTSPTAVNGIAVPLEVTLPLVHGTSNEKVTHLPSPSRWDERGEYLRKCAREAVLACIMPPVYGTSDPEVAHILSPSWLEERESEYLPANIGNPSYNILQNTRIHPGRTRRPSDQVPPNNCIPENNRRPRRELTTQHTANRNDRNIKFAENTLSIETKKASPDIRSRRCRPYTRTAWSSTACGRKTVGIC